MTKKILIADDEWELRNLIKLLLEDYDLDLTEAEDGETVLNMTKDHPDFDLLMLDNNMPGYTGYEIIQKLKFDPKLKDIPIIMLTGKRFDPEMQKIIEKDVNDYLMKPFEEDKILAAVEKILGKLQPKRSAQPAEAPQVIPEVPPAMIDSASEVPAVIASATPADVPPEVPPMPEFTPADIPAAPEVPAVDTPAVPDIPAVAAPEVPATPAVPDIPAVAAPEVPIPDVPPIAAPEIPSIPAPIPDIPPVAVEPAISAAVDTPAVPDVPAPTPDIPVVPQEPYIPEPPGAPSAPGPDIPLAPEMISGFEQPAEPSAAYSAEPTKKASAQADTAFYLVNGITMKRFICSIYKVDQVSSDSAGSDKSILIIACGKDMKQADVNLIMDVFGSSIPVVTVDANIMQEKMDDIKAIGAMVFGIDKDAFKQV